MPAIVDSERMQSAHEPSLVDDVIRRFDKKEPCASFLCFRPEESFHLQMSLDNVHD
jgi:hypothetical protein